MKFTLLGTGTSTGVPSIGCGCETCTSDDPRDKRLRVSVLVEHEGLTVLIDTSSDFRQQALRVGLKHLDAFAWVGGFSSAPNTRQPKDLLPDPVAAKGKLKLLFLSCGNKDGLIRISQGVHAYLKENNVPHTWHVDGNGHDATHWKNTLHHFLQHVFR